MMTMRRGRINGFSSGMTAAVLRALRVVLTAFAGLVLTLSALLFGVVLGALVLLWTILGGRRGRMVHFGWRGDARRTAFRRTRSRPMATQSDVIDVEVREVARRDTPTP